MIAAGINARETRFTGRSEPGLSAAEACLASLARCPNRY
jgi:hypothetical protein